MASAIIGGILQSGLAAKDQIIASDKLEGARRLLAYYRVHHGFRDNLAGSEAFKDSSYFRKLCFAYFFVGTEGAHGRSYQSRSVGHCAYQTDGFAEAVFNG